MAIGQRIWFIRNSRGMTQKTLGILCGFPEKNADVRMAQYESGSRTPKKELIHTLAKVLEVAPQALTVPDIDSPIGLAHTLFALEDMYGLTIDATSDGEVCLKIKYNRGRPTEELQGILTDWNEQASKCRVGEISKDTYDEWRYNYKSE